MPLFYLFRRTFNEGGSGSVFALLLGSITAIVQFFLGYLVSPGGFGFSRWMFGFIDIVGFPVLVPILVYFIILIVRGFSGDGDFANFTLLWLIPVGALRALSWSSGSDPILLVAVPMLWTALAVGISFFINWMVNGYRWYVAVLSIFLILLLPSIAAASYWAFFSQQTLLGFVLFFVTHIPFGISLASDIMRR